MELTELDLMETKLRRWRACAKDKSCIVVLVSRSKALQLLYNIFATFQVPGEESALSFECRVALPPTVGRTLFITSMFSERYTVPFHCKLVLVIYSARVTLSLYMNVHYI